MSYSYGKQTTFENPEVEQILTAVESRLNDAVGQYKSAADELGIRLKDLEQSVCGGYTGGSGVSAGFDSKANPVNSALESEAMQAVFAKQAGSSKTTLDAKSMLAFKNTILGESGSPQAPDGVITQADRIGVVGGAFRALDLLDFVPKVNVTSNAIEWPSESAWSNDAAEAPEGSTKAESDLTFNLETSNVATIAHVITLSRQVWDDAPWLQKYTADRLTHGVRQKLQTRMIAGTGVGAEIAGITASGSHTAFTPSTGDSALDSLNRAKYLVLEADRQPDFIVLKPGDWGVIERERRATGDAGLVLGDGNAAGFVSNGLEPSLWGLRVLLSNDLTSGQFILGASDAMRLFLRNDAVLEVFDSHSTYAQQNLLLLRAEMRAAFSVMIPSAIQYGSLAI